MDWYISEGTKIGPTHVRMGKPNQDRYAYKVLDSYTVLVVADGAGSLERSDDGAALVVTTVIDELDDTFEVTEESVNLVLEKAVEKVREYEDKELGSTIACVLFDENKWAAGVLGDSFVAVFDDEDSHFLSEPNREYANLTTLTTSDKYKIHTDSGTGQYAVAVSSDGITNATIVDRKPHSPFWMPVLAHAEQGQNGLNVEGLLEHMGNQGVVDDDSTLVVAYKPNQE